MCFFPLTGTLLFSCLCAFCLLSICFLLWHTDKVWLKDGIWKGSYEWGRHCSPSSLMGLWHLSDHIHFMCNACEILHSGNTNSGLCKIITRLDYLEKIWENEFRHSSQGSCVLQTNTPCAHSVCKLGSSICIFLNTQQICLFMRG